MSKDKELFYQKIQPYFDLNMVREIYSSDVFCILAFAEKVYIACPYILFENHPYGIYMNPNVMLKIANNNRKIYPIINEVFNDLALNKDLLFFLDIDKISFWEKWISENNNLCKIDLELEKTISRIVNEYKC